jgi:hypothetical protein
MRPLVAHCHLGLTKLYRRTGDQAKVEEHLAAATAMCREMGVSFWLDGEGGGGAGTAPRAIALNWPTGCRSGRDRTRRQSCRLLTAGGLVRYTSHGDTRADRLRLTALRNKKCARIRDPRTREDAEPEVGRSARSHLETIGLAHISR